jgi:hypothetical protein
LYDLSRRLRDDIDNIRLDVSGVCGYMSNAPDEPAAGKEESDNEKNSGNDKTRLGKLACIFSFSAEELMVNLLEDKEFLLPIFFFNT